MDKVLVAPCCYPIPGDRIVGIPISSGNTRIHRDTCIKTSTDIIASGGVSMDVHWKEPKGKSNDYLAAIQLYGTDEKGLLEEIVNIISQGFGINMKQMEMNTSGKTIEARFLLYVNGIEMLNGLIRTLAKHKHITEARRFLDIHNFFHYDDLEEE